MLRIARAEDEQVLLPIYTHQLGGHLRWNRPLPLVALGTTVYG
jgi:hypothetical protein